MNHSSRGKLGGEHTCNPHQDSGNIRVGTYPDWTIVISNRVRKIYRNERRGVDSPARLGKVVEHIPVHGHGEDIFMHRRFSGIFGPAIKCRRRIANSAWSQIHGHRIWERGGKDGEGGGKGYSTCQRPALSAHRPGSKAVRRLTRPPCPAAIAAVIGMLVGGRGCCRETPVSSFVCFDFHRGTISG